jgi:hypothetical protein
MNRVRERDGTWVDVGPHWKEAPGMPDMTTAAGPVKVT